MIPFNRPYLTGNELKYIAQAHKNGVLAGNGVFTQKCQNWIEQKMDVKKALLTHSCTAALEMAAILADIQPGDEIIMPSYTFVSTANAFVIRGGIPIFIDIRPDTLNIDEKLIEAAITPRTKAIVPVHYAGVGCEMDFIMSIAKRHRLLVIEDAAHCVKATYKGRELGSIGHLGALSFHETKNIICGEGGALLINDKRFIGRAEIIWQKGTNRKAFQQGKVDKYTWVDIGSSFLPGEITAAFLWAQMQKAKPIMAKRKKLWSAYHKAFETAEKAGHARRPSVPERCSHNAHMYYLLLRDQEDRLRFCEAMKGKNTSCLSHYVPLHSAPEGLASARFVGDLLQTRNVADRLVRLPLWLGLEKKQSRIIKQAISVLNKKNVK